MSRRTVAMMSTTAAVALVLAGCSDDEPTSAQSSGSSQAQPTATVVKKLGEGRYSTLDKTLPPKSGTQSVQTPDGSWRMSMGAFGKTLTIDGTEYRAAKGQTLVPVTWLFTAAKPVAVPGGANITPDEASTTIALRSGDKRLPVTDNASASGSAVVSVPSKSIKKTTAVVSFDGVDQQVSPAGHRVPGSDKEALGLYDELSVVGTGQCPSVSNAFTGTGGRFTGTCGLSGITRTAWLPERGWAGEGSVWVSLTGILNPGSMSWVDKIDGKTTVTDYKASGVLTGGTLSGTQATDVTKTGQQYEMIFKVPASTGSMSLKVDQIYTGKATEDIKAPLTAPETQKVSVKVSTPISFQADRPVAQDEGKNAPNSKKKD